MVIKKPKIQNQSTKGDAITQRLPLACVDEGAAADFMEHQRWGMSPACPLCGRFDVYKMMDSANPRKRQANFRWRCKDCKGQYTVRKGTVLEDSAIPLRHWAYAFWRASTSKKGVSALEIHRQTGVSYKSALFLLHRIRHAMSAAPGGVIGGPGKVVEVDETYWGNKPGTVKPTTPEERKRWRGARVTKTMHSIVGLLERGGKIRSFHVPTVTR